MSSGERKFDVIVIGAGLVGLATAFQLKNRGPQLKIAVVEKERQQCLHQSGRNSGVIHSGVYYAPGSLKAKNCIEGKQLLEQFCQAQGVSYRICGKVIVAVDGTELGALEKIRSRAEANGVKHRLLGSEELREVEPHVRGVKALLVESTGIVDYPAVAAKLVALLRERQVEFLFENGVTGIVEEGNGLKVVTTTQELDAAFLINCAGLFSDRICRMQGIDPGVQICPFRGEYYLLKPDAAHLCKTLIYPVPDPRYPFLGVHFTTRIDGRVECGPNAVLAFAREGYTRTMVNLGDLSEMFGYRGIRTFLAANWRMGVAELLRSFSKRRFVESLQRLVPEVREEDVEPAPGGIRAQAISVEGKTIDDFFIKRDRRSIHVLNAPSPAATSCLSIGDSIAAMYSGS